MIIYVSACRQTTLGKLVNHSWQLVVAFQGGEKAFLLRVLAMYEGKVVLGVEVQLQRYST